MILDFSYLIISSNKVTDLQLGIITTSLTNGLEWKLPKGAFSMVQIVKPDFKPDWYNIEMKNVGSLDIKSKGLTNDQVLDIFPG